MEWAAVSAICAVAGLVLHVLSDRQNAKTRASIAELKCELVERQHDEIAPLREDVAAMGARVEALAGQAYLRR